MNDNDADNLLAHLVCYTAATKNFNPASRLSIPRVRNVLHIRIGLHMLEV
jgi:hypothetical protein